MTAPRKTAARKKQAAKPTKNSAPARVHTPQERELVTAYRLMNTYVKVALDADDEVFKNALCWAMLQRIGLNNATRIALKVDEETYGKFPVYAHSENFWGISEDAAEFPDYFDYLDITCKNYLIAHYAATRFKGFDIPDDAYVDEIAELLHELRPNGYEKAARRADDDIEEIDDAVRKGVAAYVRKLHDQYGDMYELLIGNDGDNWYLPDCFYRGD